MARAFVRENIQPAIISGVSAGAIAGAAHALDPVGGKGIDLVVQKLGGVTNAFLKLDVGDFVGRAIAEREHLKAIGDNVRIGELLNQVLREGFHLPDITLGAFGKPIVDGGPTTPQLMIPASNLVAEEPYWFGPDDRLEDVLVISSAIPGIFPWRERPAPGGGTLYLVDGGITENQPLTTLAQAGCGRIYACTVGAGPITTGPSNLVDNFLRSINITMHQCMKLEEQALRPRIEPDGRVIHIHPPTTIPLPDFNFTPEKVNAVVDEACSLTRTWLQGNPQS
jgi:predicted acylesterase/phospholipase RssA